MPLRWSLEASKRDKKTVKHILTEKNPFFTAHRRQMRRELVNQTPSLLSPNCLGGILFHDLGLKFQSPTVNLMMFQNEFAKFVLNMDHYLEQELVFFQHPEFTFPCAKLDDLTVHFTHYKTEEDARRKWKERCDRIDRDNLFVILMERDGLSYEDMIRLGSIKARGLVIFTAHEYSDLPYTLQIKKYAADGEIGNTLRQNHLNGSREYEQYFNFMKWFNEAEEKNHDITPFAR